MFKRAVLLLDLYGPLWLAFFAFIAVAYLYQPLMLHIKQREVELCQEQARQECLVIQKTVEDLENIRTKREHCRQEAFHRA